MIEPLWSNPSRFLCLQRIKANQDLRVFLTGEPGVGKTTAFLKIVNELRVRGLRIGGFYCPEVREGGIRVGFKIVDLETQKWKWLARTSPRTEIKVGKYYVQPEAQEIVDLVAKNLNEYSLIAIDEIGPMELALPAIRDFINRALTLNKDVLAVVHRKVRLKGDYVFVVTPENRDEIPKKVVELFITRPL